MRLLILNAGSSSLQYSVIDAVDERVWLQDESERQQSIRTIVGDIRSRLASAGGDIEGVVHRAVHGGTQFTQAVRITPDVRRELDNLSEDLVMARAARALVS
jgi:acetate kinase